MARSGILACIDCKVDLWLGRAIPNDTIDHFVRAGDNTPNWQNPELNRVIWKMLADHASHELRVLLEWTPEFDAFIEDEDVFEIGGDEPGHNIKFAEYLKDWEG